MITTDTQTIRLACAGDDRAMRTLWTQYAPVVDAVVRRMVADPDQAEDVAQEVWIQIFRALPSYRGDAQFSTWVHRIAVNRTLNALRRLRRLDRLETDIAEDSAFVEHEGDRALLAASISEAVARLPAGARTVFLLHDVEGYTHEEIAAELGITAGGSKSQLFKARVRLRKLLGHHMDEGGPAAVAAGRGGRDAPAAPPAPSESVVRDQTHPPGYTLRPALPHHAAPLC
ncbi:MAG: RNA polymerase sigma factor [Gemmatimonadaceae bacterium]